MLATARPRGAPRLLAAAVLLLLTVGAWWGAATSADAATTHRVDVTRGEYDPPRLDDVRVGDTVVWRWREDGGSVTDDDDSFDSHPDCAPLRPFECGEEGDTFAWTFDEPGTYDYFSKQTLAEGTVIVEPAATPRSSEASPDPDPTPTDEPTSEPEPTSDPTSEPEPSPEPTPSEDTESPSPTDTPTPGPSASSPAPPPDPSPSTETAAPVAVETESTSPSPTPSTEAPSVATESSPRPLPVPSFEDFPDAREPDASTDVGGTVAVGADGGDRDRTLWGVVGGVTLLGTLGAFGRRVLFGDPWGGTGDR